MTQKAKERFASLLMKGGVALPPEEFEEFFEEVRLRHESVILFRNGVIEQLQRVVFIDVYYNSLMPRRKLILYEQYMLSPKGEQLPPREVTASVSGGVRNGESYRAAAVRKMRQEMGITVEAAQLQFRRRERPEPPESKRKGIRNRLIVERYDIILTAFQYEQNGYDKGHPDGSIIHRGWREVSDD